MYIQQQLYKHLIIWKPHYYAQFALSLGKESRYIFSTFNPLYSDIPLIQTDFLNLDPQVLSYPSPWSERAERERTWLGLDT